MITVEKDEAFSGIIPRREPTLMPCQCPHCSAIFLLHKDVLGDNLEGPCPNCMHYYFKWPNHTISPIKYKFIRWWRQR